MLFLAGDVLKKRAEQFSQELSHQLARQYVDKGAQRLDDGDCFGSLPWFAEALRIDEGRNAGCSMAMRESGNWVVPTFNGQLRSHKPALLYWLQIGAYQVFGVNEFAARLPSALAALAAVVVVYELGRRMFGAATGLTSTFTRRLSHAVDGARDLEAGVSGTGN